MRANDCSAQVCSYKKMPNGAYTWSVPTGKYRVCGHMCCPEGPGYGHSSTVTDVGSSGATVKLTLPPL
jgi:hypothetical protein